MMYPKSFGSLYLIGHKTIKQMFIYIYFLSLVYLFIILSLIISTYIYTVMSLVIFNYEYGEFLPHVIQWPNPENTAL